MIVTMTTGSATDRGARCPASLALPQVHDANPADHRDRGTAMHKFLERVPQVGRDVALAEVDEQHRAFCSDIELAKLGDRLKLSTEVALAYNFREDTARRLLPLDHRAYEVDATCEIPLTIDLAGVGDGEVCVGDYKSGHGWLPAPNQSMQLGLAALALARVYEAHSARVEYVRIRDDGSVHPFNATLDLFALEGFAERVSTMMRDIAELRAEISAGMVPTVTEGPWCRWCKASIHCPAKTARIRQAMELAVEPAYTVAITPDNAAEVYRRWRAAKDALAMIEGGLFAYGKTTPIPLGGEDDGSLRWFGELTRDGNDVLKGEVVHQVLTERYGGDAANKAVTMEATKAAITNTARAHLKDGEKITHVVDDLLKVVRARGGIANPKTTSTTEYTTSADGEVKARRRKSA